MTPDVAATTARIRQHPTRRRFLGGITEAGSYMAMRGIEEAAVRTVLDPLKAGMADAGSEAGRAADMRSPGAGIKGPGRGAGVEYGICIFPAPGEWSGQPGQHLRPAPASG